MAHRPVPRSRRAARSRRRAGCAASCRFADRVGPTRPGAARCRSEEHTSELQSLMRISYAVFCLKKKNKIIQNTYRPMKTIKSNQNSKQTYQTNEHHIVRLI